MASQSRRNTESPPLQIRHPALNVRPHGHLGCDGWRESSRLELWAVYEQELATLVEHGLLDDLIRPQQQRLRDRESERLGSFHVDHELELPRLLDGEISWFCALENPVNVAGRAIEEILGVCSIRHESAFFGPATQFE